MTNNSDATQALIDSYGTYYESAIKEAYALGQAHTREEVIEECIDAINNCELVPGTNFKRIRPDEAVGALLALKSLSNPIAGTNNG